MALRREDIKHMIANYNANQFLKILSSQSGSKWEGRDDSDEEPTLTRRFRSLQVTMVSSEESCPQGSRRRGGAVSSRSCKDTGDVASEGDVHDAAHRGFKCDPIVDSMAWDRAGYSSGSDYEDSVIETERGSDKTGSRTRDRRPDFGSAMESLEALKKPNWPVGGFVPAPGSSQSDPKTPPLSTSGSGVLSAPPSSTTNEERKEDCQGWMGGDSYFSDVSDECQEMRKCNFEMLQSSIGTPLRRQFTGEPVCLPPLWEGGDSYFSDSDYGEA